LAPGQAFEAGSPAVGCRAVTNLRRNEAVK
jgi:hypothetical protein